MPEQKLGPELLQEAIGKDLSLDTFLDRNPKDVDYPALVQFLRQERAMMIAAGEKKKAAKAGEITESEDEDV